MPDRDSDAKSIENDLFDSLEEVTRGSGIGFVGLLLGKSTSLGQHVLIAQFLGATGYGMFALGRAVMNIGQMIAKVGMDTGIVHFVSRAREQNDEERGWNFFSTAFYHSLLTSFVMGLLIVVGAPFITTWFGEKEMTGTLRYFGVALIPYTLLQITVSLFMARKEIVMHQAIHRVATPLCKFLMIGAVLLLGYGIEMVILAFAIAGTVMVATTLLIIQKRYPEYLCRSIRNFRPLTLFRYSASVWLSNVGTMVFQRIDRIFIGYFYPVASVGIYNVCAIIGMNLMFFDDASRPIIKPVLSEGYKRYTKEQFAHLYRTVMRWVFSSTFLLLLPVIVFPNLILGLFGTDFQDATNVLMIFLTYTLVSVLFGHTVTNLKLTGHQDIELFNSALGVVLVILLNLLLIPPFGVVGAAAGTLVSFFLLETLRSFEISSYQGFHPFTRPYITLCSVLIGIGVLTYFCTVNQSSPLSRGAILLASTSLSGLVLYIDATDEDWRLINKARNWLWARVRPW